MNHQEALTAYTAAFVNELVLTGVKRCCRESRIKIDSDGNGDGRAS